MNQLAQRLGVGSETDDDTAAYETFWERVDTNLRADNVRLLFVADRIPDELAHVVEFLNRHMPHIEVLAVELKQFQGKGVRALVPRVIGRTAKPRRGAGGGTLTLDAILGQFPEGAVREAARQLIDRSRAAGATFEPGSRGTSIRGRCRLWGQPVTVAWLFPSEIGWMRTRHFSFGCGVPYETLPSELWRGDAALRRRLPRSIHTRRVESGSSREIRRTHGCGAAHRDARGASRGGAAGVGRTLADERDLDVRTEIESAPSPVSRKHRRACPRRKRKACAIAERETGRPGGKSEQASREGVLGAEGWRHPVELPQALSVFRVQASPSRQTSRRLPRDSRY